MHHAKFLLLKAFRQVKPLPQVALAAAGSLVFFTVVGLSHPPAIAQQGGDVPSARPVVSSVRIVNQSLPSQLSASVQKPQLRPAAPKPPAPKKPELVVLGRAEIDNLPPEGAAHNARLALKTVNGTVLKPGEVFSFNRIVGPRTLSRGFAVGKSIMRTSRGPEFVPDVGGGVCRASTVIHQAVLDAGLKVLERHSHSLPVAYAEEGRDAAVSWGSWDYRFKNTTRHPVRIQTSVGDSKLTVSLMAVRKDSSEDTILPMKTMETN